MYFTLALLNTIYLLLHLSYDVMSLVISGWTQRSNFLDMIRQFGLVSEM